MDIDTHYRTFEELIEIIYSPNKECLKNLVRDHWEKIRIAPGSAHNHQAWTGGYLGHMTEIGNIAVVSHQLFNGLRELPFSISDAVLVLMLHDIEKPFRYEPTSNGFRRKNDGDFESEATIKEFRKKIISQYGFSLSQDHWNALRHVHGESDAVYTPFGRTQKPLAAFVHHCDNHSARIWFDYPKGNSW